MCCPFVEDTSYWASENTGFMKVKGGNGRIDDPHFDADVIRPIVVTSKTHNVVSEKIEFRSV
jgi:hypothetical protein